MAHRGSRASLLFVLAVALGSSLQAQSGKTITIRVFDGKTGESLKPSNVQVSLDRAQSSHSEWIKQNDDGSANVLIPEGTTEILVRATYDNSMEYYINCDAAKERDTSAGHWYAISEILTAGVVMPNGCVKPKDAERVKLAPKPGELDLFVRRHNWREQE